MPNLLHERRNLYPEVIIIIFAIIFVIFMGFFYDLIRVCQSHTHEDWINCLIKLHLEFKKYQNDNSPNFIHYFVRSQQ